LNYIKYKEDVKYIGSVKPLQREGTRSTSSYKRKQHFKKIQHEGRLHNKEHYMN